MGWWPDDEFPDDVAWVNGRWVSLTDYREFTREPRKFRQREDALAYVRWVKEREQPRIWHRAAKILVLIVRLLLWR